MTDAYLFICADCVTEQFLSEQIIASGSRCMCMSCGQEGQKCWSIESLAEHVGIVFDADSGSRENVSPASILADLTGLSDSICEEILDRLSEIGCLDDVHWEEDDAYRADACFAAPDMDVGEIERQWQKIREELLPFAPVLAGRALV